MYQLYGLLASALSFLVFIVFHLMDTLVLIPPCTRL